MGLDVDKCRALKKEDSDETSYRLIFTFEGKPVSNNKYFLKLLENFKDFIVYELVSYTDFNTVFSDMGLNRQHYRLIEISHNLTFENIYDSSETLEINPEGLPEKTFEEKVLYYEEVEYQRKGMKGAFYQDILAGCWYITQETKNNPEDSMDFVLNNQDLDLVKSYAEEEQPILGWKLYDYEFIKFDY